jgi:hypothetical protein
MDEKRALQRNIYVKGNLSTGRTSETKNLRRQGHPPMLNSHVTSFALLLACTKSTGLDACTK